MKARPSRVGDGILLVDKPEGMTSARAVATVKKALGGPKVGHLGTLDPFASGLLPMCIGEGTKVAPYLNLADKSYRGIVRLGVESDTLDRTGTIRQGGELPVLGDAKLQRLADRFKGEIEQIPPTFSAIKKNGVPMYKLARSGACVEPEARRVTIHSLSLQYLSADRLGVQLSCSKGTYVRSLARDIGRELGCGALLEQLERTVFEPFKLEDSVPLSGVSASVGVEALGGALIPVAKALGAMPAFEVDPSTAAELRLGRQSLLCRLPMPRTNSGCERAKVLTGGTLVAVLAASPLGWKLERIFAASTS